MNELRLEDYIDPSPFDDGNHEELREQCFLASKEIDRLNDAHEYALVNLEREMGIARAAEEENERLRNALEIVQKGIKKSHIPDQTLVRNNDLRPLSEMVAEALASSGKQAESELPVTSKSEPTHETDGTKCDHFLGGWREFDNGRGGEQYCVHCGIGAMQLSLMNEKF